MEDEQLLEWTKEISRRDFAREFRDDIRFNPRLRTTGGRYLPNERRIEINRLYLEECGPEELEGIIKHELCHYHLHIEGKGYHHRDAEFRRLMEETGSPRHCTPLPSSKKQASHHYRCRRCGVTYRRKRRVNTDKYRCGRCKGILEKVNDGY
ncbi:SprT family protein [Salimicrobium humidisoli]|uniref:SprT family protein n=1 Tax=Salimicrobium humidisoli TaxID=2029857 RepID=A0ABX4HS78_9BACI|nr:SprT family protein [Salimicrobium humidisoli]PBB06072.1 SprT family protein [Salimicrobium humidisoli]